MPVISVSDKLPTGVGFYNTIQEGVTAATSGDTILIYGGIYNEEVTVNKNLTIIGYGCVELNGGSSLSTAFSISAIVDLYNVTIRNYLSFAFDASSGDQRDYNIAYCKIFNNIRFPKNQQPAGSGCSIHHCLIDSITVTRSNYTSTIGGEFNIYNNTLIDTSIKVSSASFAIRQLYSKNVVAGGSHYLAGLDQSTLALYNSFTDNAQVSFDNSTLVPISDELDLITAYEAQTVFTAGNKFNTNVYLTPSYNNETKNNLTLEYDTVNNQIAFSTFDGNAIGAYQMGSNSVCKTTGNAALYSTDIYSLGFTNVVGAIDDVGERLYRTADGVGNIGVFRLSGEFINQTTGVGRAFKVDNWQGFGNVIDRNGGQVSINPSDFPNNYQIDVLIKWSATLTEAALIADTSIQFVRFRLRPNETNYYVDNSGVLVGDGDPTYLSLVDATDGGSGVLVPQNILAKSYVVIAILQDS